MSKLIFRRRIFLLHLIAFSFLFSTFIVNSVYASTTISPQKEYGDLDIEYLCAGPNSHEQDILNIEAKVKDADTGDLIDEKDMKVHKYYVYRDEDGAELAFSGELEYDKDDEEWQALEIDLFWTGNGKFYVTVEFQSDDMKKAEETDISDNEKYTYERASIWEIVIIVTIALVVIFGIVILIVRIRLKREGVSVERKTKDTKKEVKFKTLSEDEIKKAKQEKKKEKKEKGKTEVSEDLIFSVPKWEVEDDDE